MKKNFNTRPGSSVPRSNRREDAREDKRPSDRREPGRNSGPDERKTYGRPSGQRDQSNPERRSSDADRPRFGRRPDGAERTAGRSQSGEGRRERTGGGDGRRFGDVAGRRPFGDRREEASDNRGGRGRELPSRRNDTDRDDSRTRESRSGRPATGDSRREFGDRTRRNNDERPARTEERSSRGRGDRPEGTERRPRPDGDGSRTERRAYPARENNRERPEQPRSRSEFPRDGENKAGREGRPERIPYTDNRRPTDSRRSAEGGRRDARNISPSYYETRFGKKEERPESGGLREKRSERGRSNDAPERRSSRSDKPKDTPTYNFKRVQESVRRSPFRREKEEREPNSTDQGVRLNRYIANSGVCSRRDADVLIESGEIKVNGKIITEMGYKVQPGDLVKYGNRVLNREKLVYVLLNKPKDFITTTSDPDERKTVMDLVQEACDQRIYPVGRLDRNTTGLLLLTNDGEMAEKLAHPSNEIRKVYQVEIDKPLTEADFSKIKEGITLEDGPVKVDDLAIVTPDAMVIGLEIHSGRNRVVRRIFEHLGYEVLKLDRTVYAGLDKKDLPRGNWRFLTEKEVVKLKYFS